MTDRCRSILKATLIVRLWTDSDLPDDNAWRGPAELIGSMVQIQINTGVSEQIIGHIPSDGFWNWG